MLSLRHICPISQRCYPKTLGLFVDYNAATIARSTRLIKIPDGSDLKRTPSSSLQADSCRSTESSTKGTNMSTPPMDAASPPPGFPPLVSNPEENAGPNILGAAIGTTVLAFLFFSARFYVRSFMVKALGWDDYFMALAMALVSWPTGRTSSIG